MGQYFAARGTNWHDEAIASRILAILGSALRGPAAQWYMTRKDSIETVSQFFIELDREFVPADLQQRLRDEINNLRQKDCKNLADYIARFRQLNLQIKGMNEIDKIVYFQRGLRQATREEVQYRRCATLGEAITVALDFERAHPYSRRHDPPRFHSRPPQNFGPEPMEIDNARPFRPQRREQSSGRFQGDRNRSSKWCRYCKKSGHEIEQCYKLKNRNGAAPQQQQHRFQRQTERSAVNYFESLSSDDEQVAGIQVEEITAAETMVVSDFSGKDLIIKQGNCDGEDAMILLDSGATCNVVKPGYLKRASTAKTFQVTRFDGSNTVKKNVREGVADIEFDGRIYRDLPVIEWPMQQHDVILGKPWFTEFQPVVNWRTHEVTFVQPNLILKDAIELSNAEFVRKIKAAEFHEVYRVKIATVEESTEVEDPQVRNLLDDFSDVFPDRLPDELPPNRSVELELNMLPDAQPSSRPPFRLSQVEQDALMEFVDEQMKKGWIELSDSPWVSNVFGIPKKDPKTDEAISRTEWLRSGNTGFPIRWAIDYRYVNSQTVVPKIPLPRIEELFDRMAGKKAFSVIDLAQGYHQMRVHPNSKKYTAFRTHNETYQWCVAPMGLAGMPGVWSRLMRVLFGKFPFVVVYLDDICVFSANIDEHVSHLKTLFEVLRKEKLYAHRAKCKFAKSEVGFLGHTVSSQGLAVDKSKTTAIATWPTPTTIKELQSFLGLAGYYRRFIYQFAHIVTPLSSLLKKDSAWTWGSAHDDAFIKLKTALQAAPVLKLADFSLPFVVTTDASGLCVGGVLSQYHNQADHPVAFYSKKLGQHEVNWPTHEKELFVIKLGLEKWRHYLYGRHFDIYTDNSACSWLMHHPKVSAKLARYLTFLAQFNFTIHHVNGSLNTVADALSRRPGKIDVKVALVTFHRCNKSCSSRASRFRSKSSAPTLLREETAVDVEVNAFVGSHVELSPAVKKEFQDGYKQDDEFKSVWANNDKANSKFTKESDLLFVKSANPVKRLCVPADDRLRTRVISECHDSPTAAHPGSRRTFLRCAQWYYWKTMQQDIKEYVKSCETCVRWKHDHQRKNGFLMPIPIPDRCWQVVSMDFITGLPKSGEFDAILTIVDKLSKRAKYTAVRSTDDAPAVARTVFDVVVRHHGLPDVIISDRDSKFTSNFWKSLMKIMGIKLSMTTAHRAQADGQTERQNLVIEDSLRCMVSYQGSDWAEQLGTIEYAHATLVSASTGFSPFEVDTGRKERSAWQSTLDPNTTEKTTAEYARVFAEEKQKIICEARKNLLKAQASQKKYYDEKRRVHQIEFKKGDLVMLDTKRIPLAHATQGTESRVAKLAARKVGPFEILRMINPNVAKLKLPKSMKRMNPTFNVDILQPYVPTPDKFMSRPIPKASKIVLAEDNDKLYIVNKLLRKRQVNSKPEWLVKWHGYAEHEATWEREQDIRHVAHWKNLVDDYKRRQRELKSGEM